MRTGTGAGMIIDDVGIFLPRRLTINLHLRPKPDIKNSNWRDEGDVDAVPAHV